MPAVSASSSLKCDPSSFDMERGKVTSREEEGEWYKDFYERESKIIKKRLVEFPI